MSFEPVTWYEAPSVLLTQLTDNELTFRSFRQTLFDSHSLSPTERESYVDRIKDALGVQDSLGGALVDVAANPWTWLFFATSPFGAGALASGSKRVFQPVGKAYNAYVNKWGPVARIFGTASQSLDGTPIPAALRQVAREMEDFQNLEQAIVGPRKKALMDRLEERFGHKLTTLDHETLSRQGHHETAEYVLEMNTVLAANMRGEGRSIAHSVPRLRERTRIQVGDGDWADIDQNSFDFLNRLNQLDAQGLEGTRIQKLQQLIEGYGSGDKEWRRRMASHWSMKVSDFEEAMESVIKLDIQDDFRVQVIDADLHKRVGGEDAVILDKPDGTRDGFLYQEGVEDPTEQWIREQAPEVAAYRDSSRELTDATFNRMFVDESHVGDALRIDRNKLLRLYHQFQDQDGDVWNKAMSMQFIERWMDPKILKQVWDGTMSAEEFVSLGSQALAAAHKAGRKNYFPRNTFDAVRRNADGDMLPMDSDGFFEMMEQRKVGWDTNRALFRSKEAGSAVHPEDLDVLARALSPHMTQQQGQRLLRARSLSEQKLRGGHQSAPLTPGALPDYEMFERLNMHRALGQYTRDVGRTYASRIAAVDDVTRQALDDFKAPHDKSYAQYRGPLAGDRIDPNKPSAGASITETFSGIPEYKQPAGGFSLADVIEGHTSALEDPALQGWVRNSLMPRVLGQKNEKAMFVHAAAMQAHKAASTLVNSGLAKTIRETPVGGWVKRLETFANTTPDALTSRMHSGEMASWLYAAYLGANLGSVVLNLTQPIMFAGPTMGFGNLARGYADTFKQLSGYIADRSKLGVRITPQQRRDLIHKHFPLTNNESGGRDLLDMTSDMFDTIEFATFSTPKREETARKYWTTVFPLKLFEKGEWVNRLATGNGMRHAYLRAGRGKTPQDMLRMHDDIEQSVQRMQFGSQLTNTPRMFLDSKVFNSPLLRMFLPFQVRTLGLALMGGKAISGGTRRLGFGDVGVDVPWWVHDPLRVVGGSAIAYELGKGLLGADLSRGLAIDTFKDIAGGDRLARGDVEGLPIPPIIDLPLDMLRGTVSGDWALVRDALPRMLPGGVAMHRAMGVLPKMPFPVGSFQKTHIGWDTPAPDGSVPEFKADGTLVGYRKPWEAALRGFGADLGRWQDESELQRFLIKQGDQMRQFRREFVAAHLAGDLKKASALQAQYETKFGIPLMVKPDQWKTAIAVRETPRVERSLERIEKVMREDYTPYVEESGFTGLEGGLMETGPTIRSRIPARNSTLRLDPSALRRFSQISEETVGRSLSNPYES